MKRTNHIKDLQHFAADNRRLLVYLGLLLAGTLGGILTFLFSSLPENALSVLLKAHPQIDTFGAFASQWAKACLSPALLLLLLFLGGLSVYGAPVTIFVPLFYGLGLGLTEASYFAAGGKGVAYVALLVLPSMLVVSAALLMGCAESLRMSLLFGRQILPSSVHTGSLWRDFRLYCMRFALFAGIAAVSGCVDVVMRFFFARWFVF